MDYHTGMRESLNFNLTVSILKEGKRYIAYSPALELSTSGKNETQAKKHFEEAVDIFFEEVVEAGTLEDVLANLGWKKAKNRWEPPRVVSQRSEHFRVPIHA